MEVAADNGDCRLITLDEADVRRAAGQRFDTDRTRPGVQVENARTGQRTAQRFERGEQAFARAVGCGASGAARRDDQPATTCRTGDDARHGPVRNSPVRNGSD